MSVGGSLSVAGVRAGLTGGEWVTVRICGGSMRPLIPDGARVRIRRLRDGEPQVGDIVAVDVGSALVVHRVISVGAQWLRTRGDSARAADAPIPKDQVVGIASEVGLASGLWMPAVWSRHLGTTMRGLHGIRRAAAQARRGLADRSLS